MYSFCRAEKTKDVVQRALQTIEHASDAFRSSQSVALGMS